MTIISLPTWLPLSPVYSSALIVGLTVLVLSMGFFQKKWDPKGLHCYVTGGSQGLGLAVAILLAQKGAHVSIVARNEDRLQKALKEIETHRVSPDQKFNWYSYSLTNAAASGAALEAASKPFGGVPPDAAFLCAGASKPKFFVEMDESELLQGMENGYWVQAFSALELAKLYARKQVNGGKILFVGSTLSYMSFVGFASYAPAKHALRGLADTLRSELQLYGTSVHFFAATTMRTLGYEEEMKTKPEITKKIEGEDGAPVEQQAKAIFKGVQNGRDHINGDFVTDLFRVGTKGCASSHNPIVDSALALIAWIGIPIWRSGVDKDIIAHRPEHQTYLASKGFTQPK